MIYIHTIYLCSDDVLSSKRGSIMQTAGSWHSRIPGSWAFFTVMLFLAACGSESSGRGKADPESEATLLSHLIISSGVFIPAFDMDTTEYTVSVTSEVDEVTFTPYAAEPSTTITVKGRDVASGSTTEPIHLESGLNTIPVVVKAGDGSSARTYNVVVTRFTPGVWTWVSGDQTPNHGGVYGAKGVAETTNNPGGRRHSLALTGHDGTFWLFGGLGFDSAGSSGDLNDLWKFDGTTWTWVSGDALADQASLYGVKGVASGIAGPGAREGSIGWTDEGGNLWLYGGWGLDAQGNRGPLGDMWKFDGSSWTWVSGDTLIGPNAVYGVKGVAASANKPGNRAYSISWKDDAGNFWLFGGLGVGGGLLNDLWKYDGARWTWVSGDSLVNQRGSYGVMGTASETNKPGARYFSVSWKDKAGNLWLFGGHGYDGAGTRSSLNDLWKFDGVSWTWVSGDATANHCGVYGLKGTPDPGNKPGTRKYSVSWTDKAGNLWLFGGWGMDGDTYLEYRHDYSGGHLNDLWRFDGANWTWISGDSLMNDDGNYGDMGVPSLYYMPGARYGAAGWVDRSGFLWLFGGMGYQSTGDYNDLWRVAP